MFRKSPVQAKGGQRELHRSLHGQRATGFDFVELQSIPAPFAPRNYGSKDRAVDVSGSKVYPPPALVLYISLLLLLLQIDSSERSVQPYSESLSEERVFLRQTGQQELLWMSLITSFRVNLPSSGTSDAKGFPETFQLNQELPRSSFSGFLCSLGIRGLLPQISLLRKNSLCVAGIGTSSSDVFFVWLALASKQIKNQERDSNSSSSSENLASLDLKGQSRFSTTLEVISRMFS